MKAIILAAGRGKRLGALTDDRPKCLVSLQGQPLLSYQVRALRQGGCDEIGLVRVSADDAKGLIEEVSERARQLGGDAVILGDRSIQAPSSWYGGYENITQAVVIAWRAPQDEGTPPAAPAPK